MMHPLSNEETLRYHRQIGLHGFDFEGQERLKAAKVLIVGIGGLGCAAAQYLASAGVGHLTLLDFDQVSLSNLQRQVLHSEATVGQPKVLSACQRLTQINSLITLKSVNAKLDDAGMTQLLQQQQLVIDCSDNRATREQLNRLCYIQHLPLVSGAAIRMEGQISVFTWQPNEPCYLCMSRFFGADAQSCSETGVMAPLVGVIGAMQAMEAIRLLTHYGKAQTGKLLLYDALALAFHQIKVKPNPACKVCGDRNFS